MNHVATDTATIAAFEHAEAMHLQTAEYERTLDLLRSLGDDDWSRPVPACPDWDLRQMYLHVLGASEGSATIRENMHQMRRAMSHRRAHGGPLEAALSNVQVREREHLTPAELVERLAATAPTTVRKRSTMPRLVRKAKLSIDGPVHERWELGYLLGTIYLRDMWMHRLDTCEVLGREPVLTPDHDGRIVADVVGEWARRHGSGFRLSLTGPAGGEFVGVVERDASGGEPHLELDAVEFCRTVGGRREATGLLATVVPF